MNEGRFGKLLFPSGKFVVQYISREHIKTARSTSETNRNFEISRRGEKLKRAFLPIGHKKISHLNWRGFFLSFRSSFFCYLCRSHSLKEEREEEEGDGEISTFACKLPPRTEGGGDSPTFFGQKERIHIYL